MADPGQTISFRGQSHVVLPNGVGTATLDVQQAVSHVADHFGVDPMAVRVAAWAVVMARHRGLSSLCLELEGMVAPLVEGRCRVFVDGGQTFAELFTQIGAEASLSADEGEPVVARLVMGASRAGGAQGTEIDVHQISFVAGDAPVVSLPSAEVDAGMATFLVGHVVTILRSVLAEPETRLDRLEMSPDLERRLMGEWNATDRPYPLDRTYGRLLVDAVQGANWDVAIAAAGTSERYCDFLTLAAGAAQRLREAGVGSDKLVALLVDRNVDTGIALVGTLLAGGAFLALDPRNPARRLAHLLDQAAPRVVVVADHLRADLEVALELSAARPEVLELEDVARTVGDPCSIADGSCSDLAYVVATSGTTGMPKLAMVEQRGFVNHCLVMIDELGLTSADVVAQTASLSFDISIWQYLTPPLVGARVEVIPDDVASDPLALLDHVARTGVTVLQVVPSLMRAVIDMADAASIQLPSCLRLVIPTGEALPVDVARDWLTRFPSAPLLNAYGPAECSDDVTLHLLTSPPEPKETAVAIGRPVANHRVWVMDPESLDTGADAAMRAVPVGVTGEICVGGVGVGRGYRNAPDRTAEVFLDDPTEPGSRIYRTGDLGRFRSDGVLEYAGRRDHQLKIRGFRVEAGEVETALNEHPGVNVSVVVGQGEGATRRLVAFVVPVGEQDEEMPQTASLRAHLEERVPSYMVPSIFLELDRLPLTPNGKLDRNALPDAVEIRAGDQGPVAPTTDAEHALLEVWRDILRIDALGIDDDFFELGGTSIMAATLFWRLARELDVDLRLSMLVLAPTVRQLAEMIDHLDEQAPTTLVPLVATGQKLPLFLFHAQGGETLGYRYVCEHLDPTRPVYGIDPTRIRGRTLAPVSMGELVDRYLAIIRERQPVGPYYLGGFCMGGDVAWEAAQRLRREGDEVGLLVLLQNDHPDYPRVRRGMSPMAVRMAILRQRFGFEVRALRDAGRAEWRDHLDVKVFGKLVAAATLPFERRLDGLADKVGRVYAGSERLDIDRWRRSDGGIYEGHSFSPYEGEVLLVRARHQPAEAVPDPTLGWGPLLKGPYSLEEVPGRHLDFLSRQGQAIAEHVDRHLRRVDPTA